MRRKPSGNSERQYLQGGHNPPLAQRRLLAGLPSPSPPAFLFTAIAIFPPPPTPPPSDGSGVALAAPAGVKLRTGAKPDRFVAAAAGSGVPLRAREAELAEGGRGSGRIGMSLKREDVASAAEAELREVGGRLTIALPLPLPSFETLLRVSSCTGAELSKRRDDQHAREEREKG